MALPEESISINEQYSKQERPVEALPSNYSSNVAYDHSRDEPPINPNLIELKEEPIDEGEIKIEDPWGDEMAFKEEEISNDNVNPNLFELIKEDSIDEGETKIEDPWGDEMAIDDEEMDHDNVDACESLDYSDEDSEPLMKKPKGEFSKMKSKKSSDAIEKKGGSGSSKENSRIMTCTKCQFQTTSAISFVEHLRSEHSTNESSESNSSDAIEKMSRSVIPKRNSREMNCPECEFLTRSASSFITHLRRKHSTSLVLAGLALRCDCGVDALSYSHNRTCDIANYTLVRLRDGPIQRINDIKTTPQCILCEWYPRTADGYITHLHRHHNTVLSHHGIFLQCSCGMTYRSSSHSQPEHNKECTRREYSLHKVADVCSNNYSHNSYAESRDEPAIIPVLFELSKEESLDEISIKDEDYWGDEMEIKEEEIPNDDVDTNLADWDTSENREINSNSVDNDYRTQENFHEAIDKMDWSARRKRNSRIMNCTECEYQTTSAGSYIHHLRKVHFTTLTLAGLALRCDCGVETRSSGHISECDIANFTVVRKRDGPIQTRNDVKTTPQCLLCDAYPKTAYGYICHLKDHHNSVLRAHRIWLLCECGAMFFSKKPTAISNHTKECTHREYTLHKCIRANN